MAPEIFAAMATMIVSPAEARCRRISAGSLDLACLQTLVFSAKESFFKAAFSEVNAFFDVDAVELTGVDSARSVLHLRCTHTLSRWLPQGRTFQAQFYLLDAGSVLTAVILRRS